VVNQSGGRGAGTFELRRYLSPVVDDDAPRSLQPFLQRASSIFFTMNVSGFVTQLSPVSSFGASATRSDTQFGPGVGVDIYVTPLFALTGGLGYSYDALHDDLAMLDQHAHGFFARGGFGFRVKDARFDVQYAFQALDVDGAWAPLRWGTLTGTAFIVIDRRAALKFWGEALESGGGGGLEVDYYPLQSLGLFAGAYGARGKLYNDDTMVNRFRAWAGFSYWFTARVRAGLEYEFLLNDVPLQTVMGNTFGYDEYQHGCVLDLVFRIP
jgi:hypothetical protein